MTVAWAIKGLLAALLLPPGNGLALLGLAALCRRRRWAFGLALVGGLLLLLQSLPLVGSALMGTLEDRAGAWQPDTAGAQAIVILGSGLIRPVAEFGGETATDRSLIRLRHGARLARETQLPVLISGGRPLRAENSEAAVMAGILKNEFGIAVRWREEQSQDTAGNARYSAEILRQAGITRVVLVTQAFHMPRARLLFEAAGLQVGQVGLQAQALGAGAVEIDHAGPAVEAAGRLDDLAARFFGFFLGPANHIALIPS